MYIKTKILMENFVYFLDGMIFQSIMDLFFAGTETTSTSLLWIFYFFIKHPDVQEKCRQEVLEVRLVTSSHVVGQYIFYGNLF